MTDLDLVIVGGGVNGASIARDAAGRGLRVLLVEKDDLASHTSSASSKLIHGGLRYLEQYAFRLVAEALAEREVLLQLAPHLIRPLTFVLPHAPHLRPLWLMRLGLFLYDRLGGRTRLPKSRTIDLSRSAYGAPLAGTYRRGFAYSDAWVDDARLTILTARDAADRGAAVRTRTACVGAQRDSGRWRLELRDERGRLERVAAKALVNATGGWAGTFAERIAHLRPNGRLKLVKGSHIVVPQRYRGDQAYILQNPDRRVVFMIPYGDGLTCIGTTDVPVDSPEVAISDAEISYLCDAVSRYTSNPVRPADVVNCWSGVRALYDDGAAVASEVSRDYRLVLDAVGPPALSVYGGKITTARRLAEQAIERLRFAFPNLGPPWTRTIPLPGGDFGGASFDDLAEDYGRRYPALDPGWLRSLLRRHGTLAAVLLQGVRTPGDLGQAFGGGLFECEARHLVEREWARTPDDLLWRRTKAGLRATPAERARLADWLAARSVSVV